MNHKGKGTKKNNNLKIIHKYKQVHVSKDAARQELTRSISHNVVKKAQP